ncbi:MAG: type II toxin-antitoxin system RelE/ParE family toxin [Gemmatimonadaceae bacterium]
MTRRLRWTEQATTQLGAIAEYISVASPVYAEQMVDRLVRRLDQACAYPESGRIVPEIGQTDVRELLEWPYRLIYRVRPDVIEVLSILHGRQELRQLS